MSYGSPVNRFSSHEIFLKVPINTGSSLEPDAGPETGASVEPQPLVLVRFKFHVNRDFCGFVRHKIDFLPAFCGELDFGRLFDYFVCIKLYFFLHVLPHPSNQRPAGRLTAI
jgi:hypothetical protein